MVFARMILAPYDTLEIASAKVQDALYLQVMLEGRAAGASDSCQTELRTASTIRRTIVILSK